MSSPAFPSESPKFPAAIFNRVLNDGGLEKSDLRNTSLVCRNWAGISQRLLFSSLPIDPLVDHPLYHINSNSLRLIGFIRHIILRKGIRLGGDGPNTETQVVAGFPSFLHEITKLESLCVDELGPDFWRSLSREAFQELVRVFGLESFRSLVAKGREPFPFIFLHYCSNLKVLTLNVINSTQLPTCIKDDPEILSLMNRPTIYLTALSLVHNCDQENAQTSTNVFTSFDCYFRVPRPALQALYGTLPERFLSRNEISFERLRSLRLLYISRRGSSMDPIISHLLCSYGKHLNNLILIVRLFNLGTFISPTAVSALTNLHRLRIQSFCGLKLNSRSRNPSGYVISFLSSLPCANLLEFFELNVMHHFEGGKPPLVVAFLNRIFNVLSDSRFTGLKKVVITIRMRLWRREVFICTDEYKEHVGYEKLLEKGVDVRVNLSSYRLL